MVTFRRLAQLALACAGLHSAFAHADASTEAGKQIFERRCVGCHQGASASGDTLGPSLVGIFGRKAGTGDSGVHSRAAIESGTVWTRDSLRRYLSEPGRQMPGTIMPPQVQDPKELDQLLDYLQSLR